MKAIIFFFSSPPQKDKGKWGGLHQYSGGDQVLDWLEKFSLAQSVAFFLISGHLSNPRSKSKCRWKPWIKGLNSGSGAGKNRKRARGGQYPKFFEDVWEAAGPLGRKVISLESSWRGKENHFTVGCWSYFCYISEFRSIQSFFRFFMYTKTSKLFNFRWCSCLLKVSVSSWLREILLNHVKSFQITWNPSKSCEILSNHVNSRNYFTWNPSKSRQIASDLFHVTWNSSKSSYFVIIEKS